MVTEEEIQEYQKEALQAQKNAQQVQTMNYASSMFGGQKQNLIEWELDFSQELEDIERLLRCDIYVKDTKGNGQWIENPDVSKVFLNNLGVSDVLRKIKLLVNKNKVLSNYTIEEINKRVYIIVDELRVLIYNNHEKYGIRFDDEYKMNNFSSVVIDIGSIIEDAYRRALSGETHKGLNEQRLVTQNDPMVRFQQQQMPNMQKNSHWYNPTTWGR